MSGDALLFNGTELIWNGHGTYKATSGITFENEDGSIANYQQAKFQNLSDKGPIPEGKYSFRAVVSTGSPFTRSGKLDTRQGIQELSPEGTTQVTPPGWKAPADATELLASWGHHRVRLNIIQIDHRDARHRGGFYLHDSHKGHTHGCVETTHEFFERLYAFAADQVKLGKNGKTTLVLIVKYPSATTVTNGGTQF